tara:strand:+ start:236 stop:502 length:267 start_codon:yes stop_codon:yes gene_type:complete
MGNNRSLSGKDIGKQLLLGAALLSNIGWFSNGVSELSREVRYLQEAENPMTSDNRKTAIYKSCSSPIDLRNFIPFYTTFSSKFYSLDN